MTTLANVAPEAGVHRTPMHAVLQCIDCGAALEESRETAFQCVACGRVYPTGDGILHAMDPLQGNNRVAATFYDGPWWKRYRRRERVAFAFLGGERRIRRRLLASLPDLAGRRLLDLGIGDGANIPYVSPACEVFGVDVSLAQLRDCRRKHPRAHLALAEAEHLPFRERSFDHAITIGAFNLFNSPRSAILQIARVVRPGGTVLIVDEVPGLVDLLPGHRLGLHAFDRWVLARAVGVGRDFASLLQAHRDVDFAVDARELLDNVNVEHLWGGACYCLVATVR